jgi:hypothetical protein
MLTLFQIAEPYASVKTGVKLPRPWILKIGTWLEVRPHQWKLTVSEQLAMARNARLAFLKLRVPEHDPAWDNVRVRLPRDVNRASTGRGKRWARKGSVPTPQPRPIPGSPIEDTLETLATASQSMARKISRASRSSSKRRTPIYTSSSEEGESAASMIVPPKETRRWHLPHTVFF